MSPLCKHDLSVAVPGLSSNTSGLLLGFSVHCNVAGSELLPSRVLGQDTGTMAKPQPPRGIGCNTGSLQRRVRVTLSLEMNGHQLWSWCWGFLGGPCLCSTTFCSFVVVIKSGHAVLWENGRKG